MASSARPTSKLLSGLWVRSRNCVLTLVTYAKAQLGMKTSDFLESPIDDITFADLASLRRFFALKDFRKRSRNRQGMKEDHGERFALRLMLLAEGQRFDYPLTITKHERPDFLLRSAGLEIGIEISQTTTTEINRDFSQMRRRGQDSFVEYTTEGHLVVAPGARLTSPGFIGYQDCDRVAEVATQALERKTAALNKEGFYLTHSNQLLLMDSYGLVVDMADPPTVDALRTSLIMKFTALHADLAHLKRYDSVHFIEDDHLFLDVTGSAETLRISEPCCARKPL